MELFPAIDLRGGKVVRLTHGDYNQMVVYSDNPVKTAEQFAAQGARNLHVVDLDGAKDGTTTNLEVIRTIAAVKGLSLQVGGGIRDEERINRYLELGVTRVILGTIAAENFPFLEQMIGRYGKQVAVGADARDGRIAVRGWLETTALDSIDFCERLDGVGVQNIIYTDISRDGAMQGTNLEAYRTLSQRVNCHIIASGGISGPQEIAALRDMGIYGAILGKALYTGAINLKEVLALC